MSVMPKVRKPGLHQKRNDVEPRKQGLQMGGEWRLSTGWWFFGRLREQPAQTGANRLPDHVENPCEMIFKILWRINDQIIEH